MLRGRWPFLTPRPVPRRASFPICRLWLLRYVYFQADDDIYSQEYRPVKVSPPFHGITLKVVDSQTLIEGPARSEPDESKLYFISSASESQDWLTGGLTSSFSSWRPTLDTLAIKPPVPGPEKLFSLPGHGWELATRSLSVATPYVSGALAQLKSQFRTWTVQQLRERLQSTSRPQRAGLINLYDTIQSDSAVSPSESNVDDPDQIRSDPHQASWQSKTCRARRRHMLLVVSHEPAALVRVVPYNYPDAGPVGAVRSLQSPCADSAEVTFSETTVTHPAGPSTDITESIEPPQDADPISRPVFPGIIDVKNHGAFRIPCLGQPASPSPLLEAEPLMTGPGSRDAMERRAGVRERPDVGNVAEDYERWSSPLIRTDALADTTTLARRDRLRIRWGARLFWLGCAVAERSARE
ncbi:hypothetical protein PZA11_002121 [Diplocarpon coronariae]